MKRFFQFFVLACLLTFASCAAKKSFDSATAINTISSYEKFIQEYPNNRNVPVAKANLDTLREDKMWQDAQLENTITEFKRYMIKYKEGRYVAEARAAIFELEETRDWRIATMEDTVPTYEWFMTMYPKSKRNSMAEKQIVVLNEEYLWTATEKKGEKESYEKYLEKYPDGKYVDIANTELKKIELARVAYEYAENRNKRTEWQKYLKEHPDAAPYAEWARSKLRQMDQRDWSITERRNSISAFRNYMKLYPNGEYVAEAEQRIVDIEVDRIFAGDYGKLPSMQGSKFGTGNTAADSLYREMFKMDHSEIKLTNDTKYTLTVRYSGPESKKVMLQPDETKKFSLANGTYRVAASVNTSRVTNYAGQETLDGMIYTSSYYIQTYPSFRWNY